MRCYAAPYTWITLLSRKKPLFTRIATLCSHWTPGAALLSWPADLCIDSWSSYMSPAGSDCLCMSGKIVKQHGYNPNLSKRGPEDCTLLGWKCWYPSKLVGLFYRILLVLCSLPISTPQKTGWRMSELCNAPVIMSDRRKQIRWHWLIEEKDS